VRGGERAQATPLLAAVVVLVGVVALAVVRVGADAVDAAQAQTAADAAALAAASAPSPAEGRAAAADVARADGATTVALAWVGPDAVVTVRVGHATARARARPLSPSG
jgi:hypothetical protein